MSSKYIANNKTGAHDVVLELWQTVLYALIKDQAGFYIYHIVLDVNVLTSLNKQNETIIINDITFHINGNICKQEDVSYKIGTYYLERKDLRSRSTGLNGLIPSTLDQPRTLLFCKGANSAW